MTSRRDIEERTVSEGYRGERVWVLKCGAVWALVQSEVEEIFM
jgi:hypothetical protein